MLVVSTAVTTLLVLTLPQNHALANGVIAGMAITGFIGLGLHLVCFEQGFEQPPDIKEHWWRKMP